MLNSANKGEGDANTTADGKKRCVMCGQWRISATYVRAKRSATSNHQMEANISTGGSDDAASSSHIIPRQNKGVCTACDVTVWRALELDGMEIKWCKGCKNFRPWAAFGTKGSATKCVRCRDRQKEKYALQKAANADGRQRKTTTDSNKEALVDAKAADEHPCSLALVAANGLRSLMKTN